MSAQSEIIRVAVIGVGRLGEFHVQNLQKISGVEIVGIMDVNEVRAREISEKYNVPVVTDKSSLVGKVDAVTVVVPTIEHYEVSKYFLEKGIHTLVEKPITSGLNQAEEILHIAHDNKAILQVGHVERFNLGVIKLREVVKDPRFIECHRLAPFDPRIKDVGVVLDLMIHDIDIILTVVDSEISKIEGVGVNVLTSFEDIANARITFENGCVANITASRISNTRHRKIRIFQEGAYLSLDYMKPELSVLRKVNKKGQLDISHELISFTQETTSLQRELESFIESIRLKKPPVVTGSHGRDALQVALEITRQCGKFIQ